MDLSIIVYGVSRQVQEPFFHQGAPMSSDPQPRIQTSKSHFQVSEEVQ